MVSEHAYCDHHKPSHSKRKLRLSLSEAQNNSHHIICNVLEEKRRGNNAQNHKEEEDNGVVDKVGIYIAFLASILGSASFKTSIRQFSAQEYISLRVK